MQDKYLNCLLELSLLGVEYYFQHILLEIHDFFVKHKHFPFTVFECIY